MNHVLPTAGRFWLLGSSHAFFGGFHRILEFFDNVSTITVCHSPLAKGWTRNVIAHYQRKGVPQPQEYVEGIPFQVCPLLSIKAPSLPLYKAELWASFAERMRKDADDVDNPRAVFARQLRMLPGVR